MTVSSLTKEERRAEKKAAKAAKHQLVATAAEEVVAMIPQPPTARDASSEQPKKRKAANALEGPVKRSKEAHGSAAAPAGDLAAKRERKRLKKAARSAAAAAAAATHIPPTVGAAAVSGAAPEGAAPTTAHSKGRLQPAAAAAKVASVGDAAAARAGPPVVKALYAEHPTVAATNDAQVEAWRDERATAVTGGEWKPTLEFAHAGFSEDLLHATREFVRPSPIQAQCWPIVQSGRDLVGIAATGSGKTLAFGLPGLKHILAQRRGGAPAKGKGPAMLVLAPTRELAQQIAAVLEEAGSRAGLKTLCAYGGVPKNPQAAALRRGVDVLVATPGRLEDLMQDGACRLGGVTFLVLDEADRMLDLGFEPHIRAIASATRVDRQTLMFSATWPTVIQKLASEFMASPVRVTIGSQDLSASHSVTQVVEVIDPAARDRRLEELLRKYHGSRENRVLVFALYKKEAARLEALLQRRGWKVAGIHGDIGQGQRTRAVEGFKSGAVPLLVATDVAARGLDIPDVEAVINYSFPLTTEDYVHRIGRTGRAGKTGTAHTFFSGQTDKARAGELINVLREAGQAVPPELLAFGTTVKKKESKLYGAHFKDVDLSQKASKVTFDSDDE